MNSVVGIVGLACRYPGAKDAREFWENILAQRRSFWSIPESRLRSEDFFSADPNAQDRSYCSTAAVIEDYQFDRQKFRVSGPTYRSTDLTHWLALDIAAQALEDAGLGQTDSFGRERTGVYVGNSLTGEFSRAQVLRLRWPYVRRVVFGELLREGKSQDEISTFLAKLEKSYKHPFPEVTEDTLAGGLSNRIAGRIANHFNLQGGGYTVDGACSSSLLAVCTGCSALSTGDLDVALVGGVDLSIDPFEMIGFAKTRALASSEMRVYDSAPTGFLPGEGCGFAVLMRLDDALALRLPVYSIVRGWGVSSDGSGGLTRPTVAGQKLAMERAYARADFGPDQIGYFEGHGTGTAVGDTTELKALDSARVHADSKAVPAAIGSVKANIGHTKAAAGIAGLIKAALALHHQIIPPTTGCTTPHAELTKDLHALTVVDKGHLWPTDLPLKSAVSAMGFGGINTHIVLESAAISRRSALHENEMKMLDSHRDAELFVFSDQEVLTAVETAAQGISLYEMTDLACSLSQNINASGQRAAIVASQPAELRKQLQSIRWSTPDLDRPPRIGFLFPGQGSISSSKYSSERLQLEIVKSLLAALEYLEDCGITANVAIGHSLGELSALYWAGAMSADTLLNLVQTRSAIMKDVPGPAGAMALVSANATTTERLVQGSPSVVISGFNGPEHTLISGETSSLSGILAKARADGFAGLRIQVAGPFHSPQMSFAQPRLNMALRGMNFACPQKRVFSTVTGAELLSGVDIKEIIAWVLSNLSRTPSRYAIKSHEKTEDAASTAQADFTKDASKAPAADVVVESLRKLVAKKTELPLDLIHEDSRFLRDLHFNSIAVAEILAEASFQLRIPPLIAPLELADASLSQASKALQSRTDPVAEKQVPSGLDSWVRCFQVKKQLERLLASKQALQPATGGGAWTILGKEIPQARTLAQDLPGTGIAFVYKGGSTTDAIPSLLQVVSSLCRAKTDTKFLMICAGGSSASFARTVHLQLKLPTCVLHFPALERVSTGVVVAEAMALKEGYSEASYDDNFCRSQFFLQHGYQPSKQVLPDFGTLAKEDNLLVTGGGKGIAAEIAFKVAQQVGLSLVLMGRSAPSEDPELLENLARFSKAGINHTYVEADVAALEQVSRAIADGEERMGRITALLHGAGTNTPKLLASLDEADFKRTLAPKVLGMQNLLACLRQADLKLVAALGSIIAVSGMPGEPHYALANEWMGEILEAYGKRNALCRTLLIQSSIWSGVGMGQRLGRVESLLQQGITPISVDDGVRAVCELMQDTRATGPIIVSSRFGKSETVRLAPSRLPLSRFVDKIRVHYPGVELISDTEVSTITDPYVEDHIFEGTQLFPAVMGLEAMAQVSMALSGDQASITFFNVKFDRPISIPPNGTRQLRCATLARGSGEIEVALRSEETSFQVDHFKAICRITSQPVNGEQPPCKPFVSGPLFSAGEFYGDLFFQTGRFQRVVGYHSLSAFDCSVEIDANARNPFWFHRYRPQTLVLGDAGARDALLHSLQACIPDQKILPVAVKELWIGTTRPTGSVLISSRETFRTQDRLIHDVEVRDTAGTLLERWEGLELRVVRPRTPADWNPVLLGPYSERFMDGICRGTRVTFQDANAKSMTGSVTHRPDGKPETAGLLFLSRSHCGNILMEMSSQRRRVGCDIQSISPKSSDRWRTLLGAEKWALAQLICCEANEEIDYSATRVWCVLEALKKAGGQYNSPLVYDQTFSGGWVTLHSGTFVCATQIVQVAKLPVKIAFALLASTHNENLSIFS